jgi:hypothetical protein
MLNGRTSGFSKSKSSSGTDDVDFKETKLKDGKRGSIGINLASDSIEDVFKQIPASIYSRRLRQAGTRPGPDDSRQAAIPKEQQPMQPEASPEAPSLLKPAKLYEQWKASGMKDLYRLPAFLIPITEEHQRSINEVQEEERGHLHLKLTNTAMGDRIKNLLSKDLSLDGADRDTLIETATTFSEMFVSSVISVDIEVHKLSNADKAKHENPLNVFQKDRKHVIQNVESILTDIEMSMTEVSHTLLNEVYKEFDVQIEEVTRDLKIIEDSRGLHALFDGAANRQKKAFDQEFDPIMEGALRNEMKMSEIFDELIATDKKLQEAEGRVFKGIGKVFSDTLSQSSIEIVSNYLTPN